MESPAQTPAGLRERAAEVLRHARGLWPHPAAEQLLAYAKELEAKAAILEQAREGDPTPVE